MNWHGHDDYHVADFLSLAHQALQAKINNTKDLDMINAQMLQNFFQDLQDVALGKSAKFFDQLVIQQILDGIQLNDKRINIGLLFGRRGGFRFENEISRIIQSVWDQVATEDFKFDKKQVLLGKDTGATFLGEIIDDLSEDLVKKLGLSTKKVIDLETLSGVTKKYYIPKVMGKIDVKGYEIKIKADASPQMIQIYNLLKDATFSLKNYDSLSWDKLLQDYVETTGKNLHLGNSSIFRALYGGIAGTGITSDPDVILSAIFAGVNEADNNPIVGTHLYHLRYFYELSGAGILDDNGQMSQGVKYIVYNDPHGGIYVKSTAEILFKITEGIMDQNAKWDKGIVLSKRNF